MNSAAAKAIEEADWKVLAPQMLRYAHDIIAGYSWRGLWAKRIAATNMLCVNGKTAEDFVEEAAAKLVEGTRTYRTDMTLEQNLERTIESDISSHRKKASSSLVNDRTAEQAEAMPDDPMDELPDAGQPGNAAEKFEQASREKEMLAELMKSVEGDEDLTLILMAYEERKYTPAEIETATGIKAVRVSELKRKLSAHADKFLAKRPEYADLRPQKEVR
jgi:RNA polymerase sigma factor (sigma-70 family)